MNILDMDEKKQNVLVVHNYYQLPGGEDTVAQNEISMLKEHGHKVIFYTRSNSEIKNMDLIRKVGLAFSSIFSFRTYRDVRKIIREESIDVVHVHNTLSMISQSVYYAALSMNVPVVQTVHNFRMLCPAATFYRDGHICEDCVKKGLMCAVKHKCYRGSRAQTLVCVINTLFHRMTGIYGKINYICLTEFNKTKLLQLRQISAEQVSVKPNAVPDFGGEAESKDYYVFVGRLEEIKGIDILTEAFKTLPDIKLKIVGSGVLEEKVRNRINAENINNIELLGYKSRDDVNKIMKNAKAIIMCSQWYETFGMVIAEAFSCGIPAIVGNIGNIKDMIRQGENGVLFKYDSAESLADSVRTFDAERRINMYENSYRFYKDRFRPEDNYIMLKKIYDRICR